MISCGSAMSKVMYLAEVIEVTDTQFTVACWYSIKKDRRHVNKFKKVHIITLSSLLAIFVPAKNEPSIYLDVADIIWPYWGHRFN